MIGKRNTCSRLRHLLTLQHEVQTSDSAGGYSKSWADVASLWAEIVVMGGTSSVLSKLSGKKYLFAGQIESEITHRILLRYRDGVTSAMRLVFENRVFNIRYVVDSDETRNTLELLVQEGVAT